MISFSVNIDNIMNVLSAETSDESQKSKNSRVAYMRAIWENNPYLK